jgi:hypothetical protein
MAKPPKPASAKKGAPPKAAAIRFNLKQLDPAKLVDLNFLGCRSNSRNGCERLHCKQNLKMKDVLIAAFEDYERKHGRTIGGDFN